MLPTRNLNSDQPQGPARKRKREEEACEEKKVTGVKEEPTVDENQPKGMLSAYHPNVAQPQQPAAKRKRAKKDCEEQKAPHVKKELAVIENPSKGLHPGYDRQILEGEAGPYRRECPPPPGWKRDFIVEKDLFPTFEAFEKQFDIWQRYHFHPMRKASSEKYRPTNCPNHKKLRYRYVAYHCANYGKIRTRGGDKRPNQSYNAVGCQAVLRLTIDYDLNCLRVGTICTEHNHPIYDDDMVMKEESSVFDKPDRSKNLNSVFHNRAFAASEHGKLLLNWKLANKPITEKEPVRLVTMSAADQALLFEKESTIVNYHQQKFLKELSDKKIGENETIIEEVQPEIPPEPLAPQSWDVIRPTPLYPFFIPTEEQMVFYRQQQMLIRQLWIQIQSFQVPPPQMPYFTPYPFSFHFP